MDVGLSICLKSIGSKTMGLFSIKIKKIK